MYNKGEVWFVEFPLEEDNSQTINRPVIVLDENILGVLSVKITKILHLLLKQLRIKLHLPSHTIKMSFKISA